MMRQGILIVLSGPSGTGKGTICKELMQNNSNLHYSISATTRPPRAGETNGVNYWFTAKDDFESMVKMGELLEWAEVYGNYYGTPRRYVNEMLHSGKDVVLELDTQGALQLKTQFPQGVFIYIVPPSIQELAARITKRGTESPEAIEKRLGAAHEELSCAFHYNYIVVNDEVSKATAKIAAIISAEKCRTDRNADLIEIICGCGSVD
ncbi:MAG: guanylate kinase [Negativicutes bacterium]|nr:guanylate kinase [Negativicutes bacterium]